MNGIVSVKEELLNHFRKKLPEGYRVPTIGVYYPSTLSKSCLKGQWNTYQVATLTRTLPDAMLWHTNEGKAWHSIIQELPSLKKMGATMEVSCKKRIRLKSGKYITIRGRADMVLEDTVFEFKRHNTIWGFKPKFDDVLQLNFYMECLGKPKGQLVVLGYKDGEFTAKEDYWTLSNWHSQIMVDRAIQLHSFLIHKEEPHCSCRNKQHDLEWGQFLHEREMKRKKRARRK